MTTEAEGTTRHPIVDVCGIYFDLEGWEAYLRRFARDTPGYLRAFGPSLVRHAGADPSKYEAALAADDPAGAVDVLLNAGGLDVQLDDYVASLREQGVRHQVLQGGQGRLTSGGTVNERLAEFAARHPDILEAWAGLDLNDPEAAIVELKRCVTDLGMRGGGIVHWWSHLGPRDRESHEIYAAAAELGVPLWIHCGMNFARNKALNACTWVDIDHIAGSHPDLTVIAGHGGWPWILEGMAVLQRHPNVYLDFSAHRPRYMGRTGSGWESMLMYGSTIVRRQILFGSVAWVHKVTLRDLADDVCSLGLDEKTERAWLHDNGARLLGLDG